jgi:hypothetical protein
MNKKEIQEHVITDLELKENKETQTKSLYTYVFNPSNKFSEKTIELWSKYYTSDKHFIKDSQKIIKKEFNYILKTSQVDEVSLIMDEIEKETSFNDKYYYIDIKMFEFFNNDSQFLQWLSIYNMSSPVISLLLPILFLILPLILLKLQGVPISVLKYIEILKHLFARHSIGQLFNIGSVGWDKLIYIIVSTGFYVLQVYQNIVACYKFYKNMEKIHHQLFIIRDYVDITLQHMNQYNKSYKKIKTYKPFIAVMNKHALTLQCMKDELIKVEPNTFGITKFKQIGHVMKCFYQLYKNNESISALKYSFGFNGYLDNLCGLKENIKNLHIAEGKISFTKNKNKKSTINIKTTFVDAYFPTLINANPVKNSYSLEVILI